MRVRRTLAAALVLLFAAAGSAAPLAAQAPAHVAAAANSHYVG